MPFHEVNESKVSQARGGKTNFGMKDKFWNKSGSVLAKKMAEFTEAKKRLKKHC